MNRVEIQLPENTPEEIQESAKRLFEQHFKSFDNINDIAFLYFDSLDMIITGLVDDEVREDFELLIQDEGGLEEKLTTLLSDVEELDSNILTNEDQIDNLSSEIEDYKTEKSEKQKLIDRYSEVL